MILTEAFADDKMARNSIMNGYLKDPDFSDVGLVTAAQREN